MDDYKYDIIDDTKNRLYLFSVNGTNLSGYSMDFYTKQEAAMAYDMYLEEIFFKNDIIHD